MQDKKLIRHGKTKILKGFHPIAQGWHNPGIPDSAFRFNPKGVVSFRRAIWQGDRSNPFRVHANSAHSTQGCANPGLKDRIPMGFSRSRMTCKLDIGPTAWELVCRIFLLFLSCTHGVLLRACGVELHSARRVVFFGTSGVKLHFTNTQQSYGLRHLVTFRKIGSDSYTNLNPNPRQSLRIKIMIKN